MVTADIIGIENDITSQIIDGNFYQLEQCLRERVFNNEVGKDAYEEGLNACIQRCMSLLVIGDIDGFVDIGMRINRAMTSMNPKPEFMPFAIGYGTIAHLSIQIVKRRFDVSMLEYITKNQIARNILKWLSLKNHATVKDLCLDLKREYPKSSKIKAEILGRAIIRLLKGNIVSKVNDSFCLTHLGLEIAKALSDKNINAVLDSYESAFRNISDLPFLMHVEELKWVNDNKFSFDLIGEEFRVNFDGMVVMVCKSDIIVNLVMQHYKAGSITGTQERPIANRLPKSKVIDPKKFISTIVCHESRFDSKKTYTDAKY